jgi:hypothetical protein
MFARRTLAVVLAVVLGAGAAFGVVASASAATLTIHPSGQDTANGRTGTWTVYPTNTWATSLDSNDGATTYAGGPTVTGTANVFFNMDGITAPTGPITAVTIGARVAPGNGLTGGTMRLGVANATSAAVVQTTAQAVPAGTTYNSYTYSPATDPSGGAWDWTDISTLRAVVQQVTRPNTGGTGSRRLQATEVYITVTYTAQYTITASAGAGGSISPAGATVVNENTNQTYTITPNTGYHVTGLSVDGVAQGALTSYTFSNVTAGHTIAATFALNTYTITSSAGANGSISPAGATSVNHGSNQSYTITPNSGYAVSAVTIDGVSQGALTSYTFSNVTAVHTISATFVALGYLITTSPGANGTITPASPTVPSGSNQTFLIVPNTGYHVTNVTVDGASLGAVASYTFSNVTAAGHTISATFAINQYVITTSPGANGTITPASPTVTYGANQTFTVTPNTGYHVADVLVDGVSQGAATSYTFYSVGSAHTISATFALNTYTITSSAGTNGAISPAGSTTVNHGSNQAYTITPNSGYVIADVLVDGVSRGAITSYTFSNVTAAHTISATFATRTYLLAASAGANGAISPSGNINVASGANQTFSMTPNTGYHVANVLIDGASQGALGSYTFYSVVASHTISATFAINQYVITTTPGANGTISPASPSVNHGANQSFTITPNSGYVVSSVSADGGSVGAVTSYTFSNVTAAHTLAAGFAPSAGTTFTVVSASSPSAGTVDVVFSNNVNGATIQTADFAIGGVSVLSATLQANNRTVRLATGSLTPGNAYTVSVTAGSISDTGGRAVAAPLSATFTGPAGSWSQSVPAAGVTVNYANATQAGSLTAVVPSSRHTAPVNFALLPSAYRDIHPTTTFTGMATVTMHYSPSEVSGNPVNLRLFHWTGSSWQDITTYVDTGNNTVSGTTASFSDFTLGEPTGGGSTGGTGSTRTPASSDWSLALLAAIGAGVLMLRGRRRSADAR